MMLLRGQKQNVLSQTWLDNLFPYAKEKAGHTYTVATKEKGNKKPKENNLYWIWKTVEGLV